MSITTNRMNALINIKIIQNQFLSEDIYITLKKKSSSKGFSKTPLHYHRRLFPAKRHVCNYENYCCCLLTKTGVFPGKFVKLSRHSY